MSKRLLALAAFVAVALPALAAKPPPGVYIKNPTRAGVWPTGEFTFSGTGPVGATLHISLYKGKVVPGDRFDDVILAAAVTTVDGKGNWSVKLTEPSPAVKLGTIDYSDMTNLNYWYESFGIGSWR